MFRAYIQKLIEGKAYKFIRPIFDELNNMKYPLIENDYIGGFYSVKDNPNELIRLFELLKSEKNITLSIKTLECIF